MQEHIKSATESLLMQIIKDMQKVVLKLKLPKQILQFRHMMTYQQYTVRNLVTFHLMIILHG